MTNESPTSTPPRRRRWVPWLAGLLIVGALVAIWTTTHAGGKQGGRMGRMGLEGPVPVMVGEVSRSDVPITVDAVGTVEAAESVSVRPQTAGPVLAMRFVEGKPVRRGQVLYELDRAPLEAALRQAEASMARDQAQLAQAHADAGRYRSLLAQGFVARQQAEQAVSSAAALEATVAADRAQVQNARVQLSYATIRSPIDGVAGVDQAGVGNLVSPGGATPMVVINRLRPALVSFTVPQGEVDRVRRYQAAAPIRVVATPRGGGAHMGQVVFLDNAVDSGTGTLRLKASFPNQDDALLPGQFADVTMTLTVEKSRVVAPLQAVLPGQDGHFVFVLNGDDTVSQRPVKLERQVEDKAVVAGGLQPGEKVVTDGTLQLKDGAKVEVRKSLIPPSPPAREGRRRHE
jgi:multidrug efflux system membrane fusion protein